MALPAYKFNVEAYWAKLSNTFDLSTPEGRYAATCNDVLAFAMVYLPNHLADEHGKVSFSDAHMEWREQINSWMTKTPTRDAYVAPRSCGKSTWWFLIGPMWAAAFGHVKFIGAFASAGGQAEGHLKSFRVELNDNELLRHDFPDLCAPARQTNGSGRPVMDKEDGYLSKSGFIFQAKGIDGNILGMKVGSKRPDLLILDDIEPDESSYSLYQMEKRLTTVLDTVLYLNLDARVVLCGTVTMPGSIIHQLVRTLNGQSEQWIDELNPKFTVHHHLPIIHNDDGTDRSIWPAKWPLSYLESIRHTRSYLKNFLNDPAGSGGEYWSPEDFTYGDVEGLTYGILSIDPAVTTSKRSDFTAFSVVAVSPSAKKVIVLGAWQVKQGPAELRLYALKLLLKYPIIRKLVVETNQGGDLWYEIFHDMPVKVESIRQSETKEQRASKVLNIYQQGLVNHAEKLSTLEEQMIAFPNAPHDDLVDACGTGINYLLEANRKARQRQANRFQVTTTQYN